MVEREADTRTVLTLSVGARVGVLLALLLLVGAGYLFWSPLQLYPSEGFPITCGSGATFPADSLGDAACGKINQIRRWQAGSLVVAAVIVAFGSIYAFGVGRRNEQLIGDERSDDED